MSGLPYQGSQTTSRYTPQTGAGASLLGTGIAGAAAYNQYKTTQNQNPNQGQSWGGVQGVTGTPLGQQSTQTQTNQITPPTVNPFGS